MTGPNSIQPAASPAGSLEELSPAVRKRLQQLFQYGRDKEKQGDHDYAHSMYSQCVVKDPSNLVYVEALLDNLNAKYEGKKKKCKVKANRAPFKKALAGQEWREVLKLGPRLLQENPWDVATLRGMAEACAAEHFNEVELRYLKNALDGSPKDVDVNRHCAQSLARMGQFDQSIACWHRIEDKVKSEALKNISALTVAKTRLATGMLDEEEMAALAGKSGKIPLPGKINPAATASHSSSDAEADSDVSSDAPSIVAKDENTGVSQAALEKAIVNRPEEVANYLKLAEFHDAAGNFREAEQVLRRAMPVSGGDLAVRERLEKAQIRRSKAVVHKAEQQLKADGGEEAQQQLEKARQQHNRLELDIYGARAERYPDDVALKYELGVRLKRAGNFAEAVTYFDEARNQERCRGPALLAKGECLQQMKQYTAALKAYEKAAEIEAGPQQDFQKMALYRAAVLATGLKDLSRAKNWLQKLVKIDRKFRDATSRLDKLS